VLDGADDELLSLPLLVADGVGSGFGWVFVFGSFGIVIVN
jgi:hypothetical protein